MIVTGIADEAGKDIQTQIKAHQALGWDHIEIRLINGKNASTAALSDDEFSAAVDAIEAAGLTVAGFGSAIGNWSRPITNDVQEDIDDLKLVVERMKRVNCKYIRTMSWVQNETPEDEWRDIAVQRYKQLALIAEDAGIYLLHENCTGWACNDAERMVQFHELVGSDHVGVLYDIGNVVGHGCADPWGFYQTIRPLITYVHIKDVKPDEKGCASSNYAFPGEGNAMVPQIIADLLKTGYDGIVSIEPHIATVVHAGEGQASEQEKYDAYIKYGQMSNQIVEQAHASA